MRMFSRSVMAVSVASVLGAAGLVRALNLGEPGEALLVPYALCDTGNQVNTLVGITVPGILGADTVPLGVGFAAGGSPYSTAPHTSGPGGVAATGVSSATLVSDNLCWVFFDDLSVHQLDNCVPASADDFVPFDWCANIAEAGAPALDGQHGYLVFSTLAGKTGGNATFAMFGDAALIEGNWQSAAYVPVVPMADSAATNIVAGENEVIFGVQTEPLSAGMGLDNDDGVAGNSGTNFDLRYFADPALNGSTDLVVWLDRNCRGAAAPTDLCDRTGVPVEVYDSEETSGSSVLALGRELNVVDISALSWIQHTDSGPFGEGLVNQGFVWVSLPELPAAAGGTVDTVAADGPEAAGVAFSLIRFGTAANARQVQTALAHERGSW